MTGSMGKSTVQHLNPEGLHQNPAFTQAVLVSGSTRTLYIGGQNAVNADGQIVGKGDIAAQTEQIFKNIGVILEAAGASLEHIVKWTVYIVQGQDLLPGFEVFQRVWGRRPNPPIVSGLFVSGLANPDFLVEIEAVAIIPD